MPSGCNKYFFDLEYYPTNSPSDSKKIENIRNPDRVILTEISASKRYTAKIRTCYKSNNVDYGCSQPFIHQFQANSNRPIINPISGLSCFQKNGRADPETMKVCNSGEVCQSKIFVSQPYDISMVDEKDCVTRAVAEANFAKNTDQCEPGATSVTNPVCHLYCDHMNLCNSAELMNNAFSCQDDDYPCNPTTVPGQQLEYNKESCTSIGCCWHETKQQCYGQTYDKGNAGKADMQISNSGFLNGDTGLTVLFVICIIVLIILIVVAGMFCFCKEYLCCGCNDPKGDFDSNVIYADRQVNNAPSTPSRNGNGGDHDGYTTNSYYNDGYNNNQDIRI